MLCESRVSAACTTAMVVALATDLKPVSQSDRTSSVREYLKTISSNADQDPSGLNLLQSVESVLNVRILARDSVLCPVGRNDFKCG